MIISSNLDDTNIEKPFRGCVEGLFKAELLGWVIDICAPTDTVSVELDFCGTTLPAIMTSEARDQIVIPGKSNAQPGFRIRLNDFKDSESEEIWNSLSRIKEHLISIGEVFKVRIAGTSHFLPLSSSAKKQMVPVEVLRAIVRKNLLSKIDPTEPPSKMSGCIDGFDDAGVRGWAFSYANPNSNALALHVTDVKIADFTTNQLRNDISEFVGFPVRAGFRSPLRTMDAEARALILERLSAIPGETAPLHSIVAVRVASTAKFLPFSATARRNIDIAPIVNAFNRIDGSLWLGSICLGHEFSMLMRPELASPQSTAIVDLASLIAQVPLGRRSATVATLFAQAKGNDEAPARLRFEPNEEFGNQAGFPADADVALSPIHPAERSLEEWSRVLECPISSEILDSRRCIYQAIAMQAWGVDRHEEIAELYLSSMINPLSSEPLGGSRSKIVASFFDEKFYLDKYRAKIPVGSSALAYYLEHGAALGHDPHPLFNGNYVRKQIRSRHRTDPDENDPFYHFIKYAPEMQIDPHPLFDSSWYRRKYNIPNHIHPWIDYISGGWNFGREPNHLFATKMLCAVLKVETWEEQVSPLEVLLLDNRFEHLAPHPLLPEKWTRHQYVGYFNDDRRPDMTRAGLWDLSLYQKQTPGESWRHKSALEHYLLEGELLGIRPNIIFDPAWYRKEHVYLSDVLGPFAHFLIEGERRTYSPSPLFDLRSYVEQNKDVVLNAPSSYIHFLRRHMLEPRRRPCARFDSVWYHSKAPTGFGSFQSFMEGRAITATAPHPALKVSARASHAALAELLAVEPDDMAPLPTGISSLFAGNTKTRRPSRGQVMSDIDAFEAELSLAGDHAELLQRDEPIRRLYEYFDDRRAEKIHLDSDAFLQKNTARPIVSVIMPTRNRATVIQRAIRSVLAQSYAEIELIVVDDGSTDGTSTILQGMDDPRLRIISIPPTGVSAARNVGLKAASGDYIAYIDSDNSWERSYIATMMGQMLQHKQDLAHAALRVFTPSGIIRYRGDVYDKDAMDRENYIDMNVFVHHRRVIEANLTFDATLKRCVDWDFIRRSCLELGASAYVPIIGCNYLDDDGKLERITTNELAGDYYRLAVEQMNLEPHVTGTARATPPKFSLLWPIHRENESFAIDDIWAAAHHVARSNHELIIVANGLTEKTTLLLAAISRRVPGMRVVHLWRSFFDAPAYMLALKLAAGDRLLLWASHVRYDNVAIDGLMRSDQAKAAPIEFPAIVDANNRFASGPFVFSQDGQNIIQLLPGQIRRREAQWLQGVGNQHFPVSIARQHLVDMGGFSFDYVLRLALTDLVVKSMALNPENVRLRVDRHLVQNKPPMEFGRPYAAEKERQWFAQHTELPANCLIKTEPDAPLRAREPRRRVQIINGAVEAAASAVPLISRRSRPGGLRIQINCPAPDDDTKGNWGDWHYAVLLAKGFDASGQTASVRLRDHWKQASHTIDVALHIRGAVDITPVTNALNVIWVISHPEKLLISEIEAADLVIASSEEAARLILKRFDIKCPVLPQATDHARFRFRPTASLPTLKRRALFIGNSRRQPRGIVLDAVHQNVPLDVYGQDWKAYVPSSMIKGHYVANDKVPDYYRSAQVVLNDHWESMARYGIISNRLFDVVACGGVAISDAVPGITDIFGDHVKIYDGQQSISELVSSVEEWAPSIRVREQMSREILAHHSFDMRARQIVDLIHEI